MKVLHLILGIILSISALSQETDEITFEGKIVYTWGDKNSSQIYYANERFLKKIDFSNSFITEAGFTVTLMDFKNKKQYLLNHKLKLILVADIEATVAVVLNEKNKEKNISGFNTYSFFRYDTIFPKAGVLDDTIKSKYKIFTSKQLKLPNSYIGIKFMSPFSFGYFPLLYEVKTIIPGKDTVTEKMTATVIELYNIPDSFFALPDLFRKENFTEAAFKNYMMDTIMKNVDFESMVEDIRKEINKD